MCRGNGKVGDVRLNQYWPMRRRLKHRLD
jgi:hypothetical protein